MTWHGLNNRMRHAVGLPKREDPDDRREDRGRRDYDDRAPRFASLVVAMLGLALVFSIFNFGIDDHQSADIQRALRQINYDTALGDYKARHLTRVACRKSSNALRVDVRNEFIDLKRDVLIRVFREIRNTIPPSEPSYRILDNAIQRLYGRIKTISHRIPNAHCNELYPPIARPVPSDYGL